MLKKRNYLMKYQKNQMNKLKNSKLKEKKRKLKI